MRKALLLLALVAGCGGNQEKLFSMEPPLAVGTRWIYWETTLADTDDPYLDTALIVGDTVYQGIDAFLVYSTHAGDTSKRETTVAFIRGDTLYHYTRTNGFIPETVVALGDTWVSEFDEPYIEVAWSPLSMDLGENWIMATSSGTITRLSDMRQWHLSASVVAVFDSLLPVSFSDSIPWLGEVDVDYGECARVVYTLTLQPEGMPPIELTLNKIWWHPSYGDVYHWAYSNDEALEQVLVDFLSP